MVKKPIWVQSSVRRSRSSETDGVFPADDFPVTPRILCTVAASVLKPR